MQSETLHVDGQRKSFYFSASVAFEVVVGRSQTCFWQVFGKYRANIWQVVALLNSFALSILQSFAIKRDTAKIARLCYGYVYWRSPEQAKPKVP
jgi:hypothetical protein